MPPLVAHRGRFPVAGQDKRVVGQRVEVAADAGGQDAKVAVGKVGAADTLTEQHVAPEDHRGAFFREHEDDVAEGVAWNLVNEHLEARDQQLLAVVEQPVGRGAREGEAKGG